VTGLDLARGGPLKALFRAGMGLHLRHGGRESMPEAVAWARYAPRLPQARISGYRHLTASLPRCLSTETQCKRRR
jgi:hypothetical protein